MRGPQTGMPTLKEVKAAEARMKAAQETLKAYAERPQSKPQDRDLHRRLGDELANATNDYIKTILRLEVRSN
jgi:hypothetical protein